MSEKILFVDEDPNLSASYRRQSPENLLGGQYKLRIDDALVGC